jgi:pSer/pThr/pTyr-binding forkhead associated (FHA) protein
MSAGQKESVMAALVILIDGNEIEYPLADEPMLIGRHPDCAITIAAPSVSGQHAKIQGKDGLFVLEDVGSRNGTFVNDQRIEGRVELHHDDSLQFGSTTARFLAPAAPSMAKTGPASPEIVGESQETQQPSLDMVDIDEAIEPTITDKMVTV